MRHRKDDVLVEFIQKYCALGNDVRVSRIWLWNRYLNYVYQRCRNLHDFYTQSEFDQIMQGVGVTIIEYEYIGICILKEPCVASELKK